MRNSGNFGRGWKIFRLGQLLDVTNSYMCQGTPNLLSDQAAMIAFVHAVIPLEH